MNTLPFPICSHALIRLIALVKAQQVHTQTANDKSKYSQCVSLNK